MTRIRMRKTMAGPGGCATAGQVTEVSATFADHLVNIGAAEHIQGRLPKKTRVTSVEAPPTEDIRDAEREIAEKAEIAAEKAKSETAAVDTGEKAVAAAPKKKAVPKKKA